MSATVEKIDQSVATDIAIDLDTDAPILTQPYQGRGREKEHAMNLIKILSR